MTKTIKGLIFLTAALFLTAMAYGGGAGASCSGDCHVIKPYEEGAANKELLVYSHFQAGVGCTECHERTEEEIAHEKEVYKSGDYEKTLYTREYDADFCFRCHESYKALAERSEHLKQALGRNPHESHMGEVPCYECHKAHQPSRLVCSECHKSNWGEKLPKGWQFDN